HVFLGRDNFYLHDWLKQHGIGFLGSVLERHRARDLEGHLGRVDFVIAPVVQSRLHIYHLVASQHAAFHRFLDPRFDRLDVLARNDSADDRVDEFETRSRLSRFQLHFGVAVLAAAAGLAHELANALGWLANRLAIGDLRTPDVSVDTELAFEPIDNYFEMKLAHPADDRLACLLIGRDFEAWVLGCESLQPEAEFLLIRSGLRFDCLRDDRRREFESFEDHRP